MILFLIIIKYIKIPFLHKNVSGTIAYNYKILHTTQLHHVH